MVAPRAHGAASARAGRARRPTRRRRGRIELEACLPRGIVRRVLPVNMQMAATLLVVLPSSVLCETFRPQDHGAKADGQHNDTAAVLAAAAAAAACGAALHPRSADASIGGVTGGCELLFSGGTFLTGPFELPSHSVVTVAEGATLRAMPMKQWKAAGWSVGAFLTGSSLKNLTIQGTGTIDGNGADWWAVTHDDLHYRPGMLSLGGTDGLVIQDVLFLNSPNHNIMLSESLGVRVRRIRVEAPHHSPNTDGINFGGGHDQSIVDSHISNGDDCVSIVCAGATVPAPAGAGEGQIPFGGNVVVRNLTCSGGHGVSIGSIRHGYVSNVSVSEVRFIGSDNGARIKTYPNHSGLIAGISYSGIQVVCTP